MKRIIEYKVGSQVMVNSSVPMVECFKGHEDEMDSVMFSFDVGVIKEMFPEESVGTVLENVDDGSNQNFLIANSLGNSCWIYDAMISKISV